MKEEKLTERENKERKLSDVAKKEEEILELWHKNGIFEKSLEQTKGGESFVFYDGPPFATGVPHYGHLLVGTIKDAVPRFETMRGKHIRRVWGWDCHGLPIENLIEKEFGLESKRDIEAFGVEKFNEAARSSVLRYDAEWKKVVPRMGRWIDMENAYRTMDPPYSESVWWAFKTLYEKGLIYEGYKPMHVCPRCETTLANSEVTLNYQDVKDISVTAKFELADEPGTFILAWTTTPWTLPGNVALAVGKDIEYVKVSVEGERYVLAKERVEEVLKEREHEVIESFAGDQLVGKTYKPVFEYYSKDDSLESRENGWKVYGAEFVTTESGTGVVHIAPAFGEDDMNLGKEKELPFVQHVGMDGRFKPEVADFAGMQVKKKGDTMSADIEIVKHLAHNGHLFSKEKITHSYPLCWRCDTPLMNYAASSWFVKVAALKDRLLEVNTDTRWVPERLRDGRFGKWLEGARDWAISRSRYWGAPLPVWRSEDGEETFVAGSVDDIRERIPRSGNTFIIMRHGEATSNVERVVSSRVENETHLTERGKEQAEQAGKELKEQKIDLIIASDYHRTRETAEIVAEKLGLPKESIIFDERIREINTGIFDGKPVDEYHAAFSSTKEKVETAPPEGESGLDVKRRAMEFLFDIDEKYKDKTILVVTHEYVVWMMDAGSRGLNTEETVALKERSGSPYVHNAHHHEIDLVRLPLNGNYEIDFHRPYIDRVELVGESGKVLKRVPEVFDCWFESGSMPYGQFHYPFENTEEFEKNFPANFVAEALDQTRGWFYNTLVLSVGLFDRAPFKNVVTTGLVLAEDGQKMSKRLQNYPDPMDVADKYGADAIRYYLLSSPVVRAEDLAFSERAVDEIYKKITLRLGNVVSFYELYRSEEDDGKRKESRHVLDTWIFARLSELGEEVTRSMERYELDRATRPIMGFVDDLSTWYVRRSRDRFKGEDLSDQEAARETLRMVLLELSKILAPFMPFLAEDVYRRVGGGNASVHLETWPKLAVYRNEDVIRDMKEVREAVSLALEQRAKVGVKVRQALRELRLHTEKWERLEGKNDLLDLIRDEVNVKQVVFGRDLEDAVSLDTQITPELREEGLLREFIRAIQQLRKQKGFHPGEKAVLLLEESETVRRLVEKFSEELLRGATLERIDMTHGSDAYTSVSIENEEVHVLLVHNSNAACE